MQDITVNIIPALFLLRGLIRGSILAKVCCVCGNAVSHSGIEPDCFY
jgi:hypothetical protein